MTDGRIIRSDTFRTAQDAWDDANLMVGHLDEQVDTFFENYLSTFLISRPTSCPSIVGDVAMCASSTQSTLKVDIVCCVIVDILFAVVPQGPAALGG
jgi:hypothetical protein